MRQIIWSQTADTLNQNLQNEGQQPLYSDWNVLTSQICQWSLRSVLKTNRWWKNLNWNSFFKYLHVRSCICLWTIKTGDDTPVIHFLLNNYNAVNLDHQILRIQNISGFVCFLLTKRTKFSKANIGDRIEDWYSFTPEVKISFEDIAAFYSPWINPPNIIWSANLGHMQYFGNVKCSGYIVLLFKIK